MKFLKKLIINILKILNYKRGDDSMKKIIYIFVALLVSFTLVGCNFEDEKLENEIVEEIKETYEISTKDLGEYGKDVVLNANTDSPATKRLYKIPSGTYEVSTDIEKFATFFIVKDNVVNTGTEPYIEELDYVSGQYFLTNGDNDLNGTAKKSVIITINDDESISTQDGIEYNLIFKEQ